ncbi:phage tail protein [Citrobacter sp. Cb018]|uniref:phage tail fiber protein n=1 Tax=Citrobacter sp. Cb018 TaxID=2985016 RepID=UPI00257EC539|nr:phage tail protein [Citrobacter sp. Cb018]MDM3414200.1 phage tail protein [Citrobacter sp. Cb018]
MSAGTLTLTNNSAAVSGSGTAFTTELATGDFIVVTVGGIPYTLPVKTINSNTSLTLVSNFTGPTQSGAAWYAVPRIAMNLVTAAVVTQAAEALRGLNYDKQNWQSIFSGTGNVTVKLPDGTSYTGPAWSAITTELGKKANSSDLGSAAKKNTGTSVDDVMQVGAFGLGIHASTGPEVGNGFYANSGSGNFVPGNGGGIQVGYGNNRFMQIYVSSNQVLQTRYITGNGGPQTPNSVTPWIPHWCTANTTIDSNGFIKRASPVVKIFNDGTYKANDESEGVIVSRLGVGEYLIEGCMGMNSDASWGGVDGGFEIPKDRNGQPLIWLDYEVNADGSVLVKTYQRTHPDAPIFARNERDGYASGDPIDIPSDQFVSVRVEMPENSIWHQKQREERESMEKAERERQENQQDAQS